MGNSKSLSLLICFKKYYGMMILKTLFSSNVVKIIEKFNLIDILFDKHIVKLYEYIISEI